MVVAEVDDDDGIDDGGKAVVMAVVLIVAEIVFDIAVINSVHIMLF